MKARLSTAIIAACASVVCMTSAVAQEPPALRQEVRFLVKPDRVDEFRQIQTRFTELAKERGVRYRGIWRNQGNLNEFVILTPRDNFASYDEQGAGRSAEGASLVARMARTYTSREVTVSRVLTDLSVQGTSVPRIVRTSRTTVHPGMQEKFIALVAERVAVAKKLGLNNFGTTRIVLGGSLGTLMSWHAIANMAQLDAPDPIRAAIGEEAYSNWVERITPLVKDPREINIYSYQENMSYYPEQ